eukprot:5603552-Karenia_brevis.AAC.1
MSLQNKIDPNAGQVCTVAEYAQKYDKTHAKRALQLLWAQCRSPALVLTGQSSGPSSMTHAKGGSISQ